MATKRTLTVEIVGDSGSAEASVLKLAASLERAEAKAAGANVTWTKTLNDLDKMKAAAASAAEATEKLAAVGTGKTQSGLMAGIEGLLRQSGNNQFSQAGFKAVADGLESVGGTAILAGAGLAVAGVAAVKFGTDATKAFISTADSVRQFQAVSGATAQQASVFVNAGGLMGISAENLSRAVGLMSVSMDQNKKRLGEHGLATKLDAQGNADLVGTFQSVIAKIHDTTDAQEKDVIAREAFGRSWQQIAQILNLTDDQLAHLFGTARQGPILDQKNVDNALQFKEAVGELGQKWDAFKVSVGEKVVPNLIELLDDLDKLGGKLADAATKWDNFVGEVNKPVQPQDSGWEKALKGLNDLIESAVAGAPSLKRQHDEADAASAAHERNAAAMKKVHDATGNYYDALQARAPIADVAVQAINATEAVFSLADAFDSAKKRFSDTLVPMSAGVAAADSYDAAFTSLDATIASSAADQEAAATKIDTGASQIASAQERIVEAQQGVADAQESYARAVGDAAQSVADSEKRASDQIIAANRAVMDARQQAADQALSSARAVQDAQQALLDAESQALDAANPFEAQRKREEAGQRLTRAEQDAGAAQTKSAQGILDAQAKLADVETTAAQDRARAQEEAGRRIEDANKAVEKAIDQVSKANEGLVTATDSAGAANERAAAKVDNHKISQQQYDQAVQATIDATPGLILSMASRGATWDEINQKLKDGVTHLEDQGTALGFDTGLADGYGNAVQTAAGKVLGMNQATYDLYRNIQAISQQLHVDPGILAGEAAAAGLNVDALRPTHDVGGWLPTGVSIAVNRTGVPERVLAPGESGGGGPTIEHHWHVGAVISDRQLADIVGRAVKRGNVGFGSN